MLVPVVSIKSHVNGDLQYMPSLTSLVQVHVLRLLLRLLVVICGFVGDNVAIGPYVITSSQKLVCSFVNENTSTALVGGSFDNDNISPATS